jgi:hypothetical protein
MHVDIKHVSDKGNNKKERLVLNVLSDTNIGNYIIADTTYHNDDSVSNKLRHVFWIPDQKVSKGDLVVIYTKKGTDTKKVFKSGRTTFFFYWGLDSTIWNKAEDCAVVINVKDWIHSPVVKGPEVLRS